MSGYSKKEFLIKESNVALFSLIITAFFIFIPNMSRNSPAPLAQEFSFQVAAVNKRTDFPVHWVTAGGGVLAYGAGQHVDFALAKDPFSSISRLSFEGIVSGGLIIGEYAYLAQEGLGLRIVDLEDPSDPLDLGFYPLSGSTFHLAHWGNSLFVGGTNEGVQIFELSHGPQSLMGQPQVTLTDRGIIPVEEPIAAMAAEQGKLYVATTGKEIRIYDVSDPSRVLEQEGFPVAWPVRSLAVSGDHLFVATGAEGLHILNLSVPGKAETVAAYPVRSESLYPAGRLVYLATGSRGLHLLNAGPIGTATFNAQVAPGGSFSFSPDPISINTGDTVNWTWGGNAHSTTSGISPNADGLWDSGVHNVPFSFQHTFNTVGSFPYFCSIHFFTGTVNVASAGPTINISVTPGSINFGNVDVGSTSDQTVTITNQAGSTAALTGNLGTLSAPFSIVSGEGAFNLNPGQSISVTVRFSPTAAGAASTSLSITHNATNHSSPTDVSLSGTGVTTSPIINISVTPAAVNFGNVAVGQSANQNITVTNQPGSTAALTGNVGTLSPPFSVASGGGDFNLASGQSMTVTVQFSPTAAGAASTSLSITHNATNHGSPTDVSLSGTGVTAGGGVVVSFISAPTQGKPGGRIAIQNTLTNEGPQTATATVNFYLSTDTQIDSSDIFIGKRTVRNLAPGASSGPVSTNVTIPRNTATGSYFVGAIVGTSTNVDPDGITICLSLSKPKLLLPKNMGKNISTSPTLTWATVNGASTYEVQVATDKGFTNIVASTTGLTDTQWPVTPILSNGTTYFWRVRGVNLCGPGPFSTTSRFNTAP